MTNLNKPRFIISTLLLISITTIVFNNLKQSSIIFSSMQLAISEYLGWFIILTANSFLLFSIYLLFTKYKNIRLGGINAKPAYTYTNWIAMLFSAGLGIGLLFYGVAEPIGNLNDYPEMLDNDISYNRRSEVVKYIEEKYKGRTSKILTLNTLSGKLCMKECGKIVAELNETEVNQISDSIPKQFGKVARLEVAYDESESFKKHADKYPKAFHIAKKLEGLVKNTGVHPSGISICYYQQSDIMPLQKTNDGSLVSGYDMDDVASLSVKFDILGLRTLSVVNDVW